VKDFSLKNGADPHKTLLSGSQDLVFFKEQNWYILRFMPMMFPSLFSTKQKSWS